MYQTKAATQSLTVMAQLVAIAGMTAKMFGVEISGDLANLPTMVADIIDAGLILTAEIVALYGRLRADTRIVSIFRASAKK